MTRTLPLGYLLGSSSGTYLVTNIFPLGAPIDLLTPMTTPHTATPYTPPTAPPIHTAHVSSLAGIH